MKRNILILLSFVVILSACTSSQQVSEQKPKEQEIYVFDAPDVKNNKDTVSAKSVIVKELTIKDTVKNNAPELKGTFYTVQLGAFSSMDKADKFVSENKTKLNYETKIFFSEAVKLYVIQIPLFNTKEEAEKVRNKLWENPVFKDAFIVTVEKK